MAKINFYLAHQSKYTYLLISLLILLIFSSFEHTGTIFQAIATFLFFLVFASVLYLIKHHTLYFYITLMLAFLGTSLNIYDVFVSNPLINGLSLGIFVIYGILAVYIFSREIIFSPEVAKDTILGSVCVYIFIGIIYAIIYNIIAIIDPMSFANMLDRSQQVQQMNFYYFSFVTLTTVGFGDIIAVHSFAKAIVIFESITGIFYLAVFVSRLINRA